MFRFDHWQPCSICHGLLDPPQNSALFSPLTIVPPAFSIFFPIRCASRVPPPPCQFLKTGSSLGFIHVLLLLYCLLSYGNLIYLKNANHWICVYECQIYKRYPDLSPDPFLQLLNYTFWMSHWCHKMTDCWQYLENSFKFQFGIGILPWIFF